MKSRTVKVCVAAFLGTAVAAAVAEDKGGLSKSDQLLARAQQICPVMGKPLDSMGGPIKAKSGERTIFLCCKGCLGKPIPKEHWSKVLSNLAAAQGKCPVMGRPLPQNPKATVVGNRTVFVCCPPCIEKLNADSERYLKVVDSLLAENLKAPTAEE